MTKELATTHSAPAPNLDIASLASNPDVSAEKLEKMLDMQFRWDARESERAYVAAMAKWKANAPKITKDKHVAFGNTKYNHATLQNITDKLTESLSEHGFTISWRTDQAENGDIEVTCFNTHIDGHNEKTTLKAKADTSGGKNSIQGIGSAVSYLQRYTLLALLGLATHDQDDDGRGSQPVEKISDKQKSVIVDLLNASGRSESGMLKWVGVESINDIPASWNDRVVAELKNPVGE